MVQSPVLPTNLFYWQEGEGIITLRRRASGGMVYTKDLKSFPLKRLWVRVPPRPPNKRPSNDLAFCLGTHDYSFGDF